MGHICMFLPKYHCELNFIKYFWGAVKHYLQENCDYSFATLKLNMPKALASVPVELIQKWEHRSWRFIDAYSEGLDSHSAQLKVKEYSSQKYKSHRRIPEGLVREMDGNPWPSPSFCSNIIVYVISACIYIWDQPIWVISYSQKLL